MTGNTGLTTKQEGATKTVRLADELDHLHSRISGTRVARAADCPEKQRIVAARRVKLSFAW